MHAHEHKYGGRITHTYATHRRPPALTHITCIRTRTHRNTIARGHRRSLAYAHTYERAHTIAHKRAFVNASTHYRTQTRIRECTCTLTNTHTNSHTHTRVCDKLMYVHSYYETPWREESITLYINGLST